MPLTHNIVTINGKPVARKTAEGFQIIKEIVNEQPHYNTRTLVRIVSQAEGLNHAQRVQALAMWMHYQNHHPNQTKAAGQREYNGTRT